jgi:hypothetical protein
VAVHPQSGGAISTVLVGLIGFASGALVVGTVALVRHPGTVNEPATRAAVSNATSHESVPTASMIEGGKDWPPDPRPTAWPYESATSTPTRAPGSKRPDRLSAPEVVVFDGAGP